MFSAPVGADDAVIVPLRPGRKHLLPDDRWGQVTVDEAHLTWREADTVPFGAMCRLRGQGFTEVMLRDDAPPYPVLRRIPAAQWPAVFDDWNLLVPWRQADPWWEVGLRASRGRS